MAFVIFGEICLVLLQGVGIYQSDSCSEALPQFFHGAVPVLRLLAHALHDHCFDVFGDIRQHGVERRWRLVDHLVEERGDRVGLEGQPAGKHLVQDGPESVHVSADVYFRCPAFRLLGCHEARSPQHHVAAGHQALGTEHLGDAEVEHLDNVGAPPSPAQKDVLGL